MEKKMEVLEKVNSSLYELSRCKENMYRGKVFLVVSGSSIYSYYKTRRGAEGYAKRNGSRGYYCEYSMEMVYSSYEVVEILESELNTFNSYSLWFEELRDCLSRPYLIDNILFYKKEVTDEELLKYIDSASEEVRYDGGITEPTEKIALEKGFESAEAYRAFLKEEDEREWREYERRKAEEEKQYNLYLEEKKVVYEKLDTLEPLHEERVKDNKVKSASFAYKINSIDELDKEVYGSQEYIIENVIKVKDSDFELISNNLMECWCIFKMNSESTIALTCTLIKSESGKNLVVHVGSGNYARYSTMVENVEISYSARNRFSVISNDQSYYNEISDEEKLMYLHKERCAIEARKKLMSMNNINSNKMKINLEGKLGSLDSNVAYIILNNEELYNKYVKK